MNRSFPRSSIQGMDGFVWFGLGITVDGSSGWVVGCFCWFGLVWDGLG
jgi:hypothetical protein